MLNTFMFKPTYLYIKTHNETGLKYFGKTTKDPYNYTGSGIKWLRHLAKHGNNVETDVLGCFTDKEECLLIALEFSIKHNIVDSAEWANLMIESLDGGDTSDTENFQAWIPTMIEQNKKRKWWNNGKTQVFAETAPDATFDRGRLPFNNVGAKKGSDIQKNKHWVNNGIEEMMVLKGELPTGFVNGRLPGKTFNGNQGKHTVGTKWWNDGVYQQMSVDCPGPTFTKGRLHNRVWWNNGIKESWSVSKPGSDYSLGRLAR
jgi:hypothetical protein